MKYFITIIIIIYSISANAQNSVEKNFGSWYFVYATHTITNHWSITTGFEERNYETFQNYNLTLYTIAPSYKISKVITARIGYMYLDIDRTFDPDVNPNTKENRFYEQISYNAKLFKLSFLQRLRIEHRNLNSMGLKSKLNRIRYRIKTKITLSKKVYFTASNESFINFKDTFYPENRFIANIGFKISKKIALETGYLGHYINDLHLNRLHIGLFINTDLRKKTKI